MKKLFVVLAVLAFSGCTTTAPSNSYRAAGQQDAWQISGEFNNVGGVIITIDGHKVIDASIGFIGSDSEFTGTYQGKLIMANCGYISSGMRRFMQCMVFVGNERAATLRF